MLAVASGGLSSALTLFAAGSALAQSPPRAPTSIPLGDALLTPIVDVRLRAELRLDPPDMGGQGTAAVPTPSPEPAPSRVRTAFATLERARLGAAVDAGLLRARLVFQDSRIWGTDGGSARFEPFEANLEVRSSGPRPSWIRAGRQVVVWGEGLLLGDADFSATGRSLDAVRAQASLGVVEIEALGALLAATTPSTPDFGVNGGTWGSGAQLYGLRAAWPIDPLLRIEAAGLARVDRSGGAAGDLALARGQGEIYTTSLRASGAGSGEASGFGYGAEGAFQFGRAERVYGTEARRQAWAAFAHVDKAFESQRLVPTIRLGGSYASGDGSSGGTYTAFDPILPDVHTHFGAMNVFSWSNTITAHARASIQPFDDASIAVEYRYVTMADKGGEWLNGNLQSIGQAAGNRSSELGHELDVLLSYSPWPVFELRGGYAGVLWGDGAKTILAQQARGAFDAATGTYSPSDLAHYAYLQARLRIP